MWCASSVVWLHFVIKDLKIKEQTNPATAPVSYPITKLNAVQQTSGEAQYIADIPSPLNTLHAAFVIATKANADISSIDTSAALAIPGVKTWISAIDIPGNPKMGDGNPLFVTKHVSYTGQPIGLIVADTEENANLAAAAVVVTYINQGPVLLTVADAIKNNSFFDTKVPTVKLGDIATGLKESDYVITGSVLQGGQIHFHMETHSVLAVPTENNTFKVYSATQWTNEVQKNIAAVLKLKINQVSVECKRCGGGYGGKIGTSTYAASGSALAAQILGVPVKLVMPIETNMSMVGRRPEHYAEYTVGVTKAGMLKALQIKVYSNNGSAPSIAWATGTIIRMVDTCYYVPNFLADGVICKTNNPAHTSMRGPGWLPAVFFMEHIMEHVARYLNADPEVIKRQNFFQKGQTTPDGTKLVYWNVDRIWTELKASANYDQRVQEIQEYNKQNKWTKKGIAIVPVRSGVGWHGNHQIAEVSIFGDGTVLVTHSGVEIGQGIDTKVAQAVAYGLGIPITLIEVGTHNTTTIANEAPTGGSVTSGIASKAAYTAAQTLSERLAPIKRLYNLEQKLQISREWSGDAWTDLITKALQAGVDLTARGNIVPGPPNNSPSWTYQSYSTAIQEVWVDILTGEYQLTRSDCLFDAGISLNPAVDLGQVEGGFVMGLGHFLTEEVTYDDTGILYNTSTWEYKPPSSMDIPLDMRISLLADAPNPEGFLSSKATGEPPLCMGSSALFAIQRAVSDTLKSFGQQTNNFYINSPATVDNVFLSEGISISNYTLT
jgi:xanthine dehydrogenase/oxidase